MKKKESSTDYIPKGKVRMGHGYLDENQLIKVADSSKNGVLKQMQRKIEKKGGTDAAPVTIKGVLGRQMFSAITLDRALYKQGILFTTDTSARVINREIADDWNVEGWREIIIDLKGAAGQMVSSKVNFRYPYIDISDSEEVVNITRFFKENVVINYGVGKSIVDDETYNIIKEFIKTFEVYYNPKRLTIGLEPRRAGLNHASSTLTDLLQAEVSQGYVNELIGDKERKLSYTHILRRNLKLSLQSWQRELIINWKQYNFIAGSRRIGKSYLSGYIGYREFYRKGSGYGDRNRQILYVTLNDKKAWQPFQYMMKMTEQDRKIGYVTVNTSEKEFTCTITGTKLIFITAGARGGAASYGADLVIIDEAAMIPNDFWDDLLPIIVQEKASVFAISTINEEAKQNWFYRYLLKGEMGDGEIQSIRVTIDDNELLGEAEKEKMKEALIGNQLKYWTQLYSIFPTGSSVFRVTGAISAMDYHKKRTHAIIGYDPARTNDNASFVVLDPTTFETIEEHIFKNVSFREQKEHLIAIKKRFEMSFVIMDRTGIGEGVFEIFGDLIDASVKYKGYGEPKLSEYGYWNVAKGELIDTLRMFIEEYGLKVGDTLENLIHELKNFKVLTDQGRVIQYGGVGATDDSVNALALITFYLRFITGINKPLDLTRTNNSIRVEDMGVYYDIYVEDKKQIQQSNLYKKFSY